jgi:hypothetical protein
MYKLILWKRSKLSAHFFQFGTSKTYLLFTPSQCRSRPRWIRRLNRVEDSLFFFSSALLDSTLLLSEKTLHQHEITKADGTTHLYLYDFLLQPIMMHVFEWESCASTPLNQILRAVTNRLFTRVLLYSHVRKYNNKNVLIDTKWPGIWLARRVTRLTQGVTPTTPIRCVILVRVTNRSER